MSITILSSECMMKIPDSCSRDGYVVYVDRITRISIDEAHALPVVKYGASN